MFSLFILFCSVLVAAALCSMAEAAILSLPFIRAKVLNEQGRRNAKDLFYLKENIETTLATIVIFNNGITIIGSIFVGERVVLLFGQQWLGPASAVITFLIIVFAEIIPKTIGERYKTTLSLFFAKPILWLVWLMQPVVGIVIGATKPFLKKQNLPKITEEEIKMMLKLGTDSGTVGSDEEILCNRVFRLNDIKAYQMMRPFSQIYALPAKVALSDLKDAIISTRFSRIAVYDNDPLNIVGIVQHRVLLREIAKDNYDAFVQDFMTEPIFISSFTKADTLLEK
ncbi:MAG: CNNM domain-containing protein, partial [Candidatus Omnitrophica bacterium]|nr:CNNM domain-containing protein [Candidatus Omnitrophota bacterium]